MALRYFKKFHPDTRVVLASNHALQFTTLDGLVGFFATDNPTIQQEFEQMMVEQRYGISEISPEEFTRDYLEPKKNGVTLRPVWRDELTPNLAKVSQSELKARLERAASVVGVDKSDLRRPDASAVVADVPTKDQVKQPVTPVSDKPFEPTVGRKVKRNANP